jgi:hypothetical protein
MQDENEKAVRDPIAEAIDLLEKSADPFDKACMLLRAALQPQSNTDGWVMSGWIEFSGGECPVQSGTYVEVKQRRGNTTTAILAESISWEWRKEPWNKDLDIVAYRIVGYTEAALEKSQQVSNTDGWKLVPVEPTQAMHDSWIYGKGPWSERYRAMLSAAPKAPQQVSNTPQDGKLRKALEDLLEQFDPRNHQSFCECDPSVGYQCAACKFPSIPAVIAAHEALATPPQQQEQSGEDYKTCDICNGAKGGVPGNGNIIDGRVVCDYCHADGSYRSTPTPTSDQTGREPS